MDIDHEGEVLEPESGGRQILLPQDVLPNVIHVIPQDNRPFFPGQAIPLVMDARVWLPTLEAIQKAEQDVIGVIATKGPIEDTPRASECYDVGTACRIHRVQRHEDQLHLLIEGLQRFEVRRWLTDTLPLRVQANYLHESGDGSSNEVRAYAVAIINTIKELIPLNPLYGEELKVFLARSTPDEPAQLADFAASLTSASKPDLQEVLETLPLLPRLERVVELLHAEVQIASAQMEIRQNVEQEISRAQR